MAKDPYCCRGFFQCPLHDNETHPFMTDAQLAVYDAICSICYLEMNYIHREGCTSESAMKQKKERK